jgi:hypothetical protein
MPSKSKCAPAHFTRAHQRKARAAVSSESCRRNGAKGAQVTLARYGYRHLFLACRAKRLKKPSKPELQMIGLLSTLKIPFEREYELGQSCRAVDFKILNTNKCIEVHTRIHHTLKVEERKRNDEIKRMLLGSLNLECLWVQEEELKEVIGLAAKIKNFVKGS